jgi:hypothetical protein
LQHGETARSEEGRSIEDGELREGGGGGSAAVAALILARGAAIRSLAPDERLRWVSGVLMAAREGKGEAGKRAAATTHLASKRGRGMIDWREGGLADVRVEEYSTYFLQEIFFLST